MAGQVVSAQLQGFSNLRLRQIPKILAVHRYIFSVNALTAARSHANCPIPQTGGPWLKTLPPVYLPEWPAVKSEATHFTSIIRWQGFREATYNGVSYGWLVAERDPDALADRLNHLIEDPGLCISFGERGRSFVAREFTASNCLDTLLRIYAEAMDHV